MNNQATNSAVGLEDFKKIAQTIICRAFGRSGIGGRSENQDSYLGCAKEGNVALTVCDGMGGMNGGSVASHIATEEIIKTIYDTPCDQWNEELLVKAVNNANQAVYQRSAADAQVRGMGTTATVLLLTQEAAFVAHVGDSRVYQLRNGKKVFRTFDHSRVFEMVAQNMMTEEQARNSSFSNIITRALGIRPTVEVEVAKIPYKAGDRFILCSDGIWNCLPEPQMIELFTHKSGPKNESIFLTEKVNGIGIENGNCHDNLTTIIADVKMDSKFQYGIFHPLKEAWSNFKKKRQKPAPEPNKA